MWEACHVEIAIVDIACFAWPTMLSHPVSPVRIQPFEHPKVGHFSVTIVTNLPPATLSFVSVCLVGLSYHELHILGPQAVSGGVCVRGAVVFTPSPLVGLSFALLIP